VVNTYFEKDVIEKVFRTFKTLEEIEPVRYLNVTKNVQETLRKMGFPDLLKESIEIDLEM